MILVDKGEGKEICIFLVQTGWGKDWNILCRETKGNITCMVFDSWGWGKRTTSPDDFWSTRLRETKSAYFWCKLAEGRIKIFRVVKLRGTKQICILSRGAERNRFWLGMGELTYLNLGVVLLRETKAILCLDTGNETHKLCGLWSWRKRNHYVFWVLQGREPTCIFGMRVWRTEPIFLAEGRVELPQIHTLKS